MNKAELVSALAEKTKLTQKDVTKVLEAFIDVVTSTLKKGDDITLVGFGAFKVSQRKERMGRNPKTGAPLKIAKRKVPGFRAGKALKEAVA